MKPNCQQTWGYHASKAWYLLHAANYYHCIQVLMANTGGERMTDTFCFKHHAIPIPEITATNRIIDATTRLTAAIAGIQDSPPNEMEAIQSLCTLLLGEVAPLPPPTPSILPTPPPPTPVVEEDKPIIIWNPQLVQPALPTPNVNTDDFYSKCNTPAIVKDDDNNNDPVPGQHTQLPFAKPSPHTQPIETTLCSYDHLHQRRRIHAHICTLHLSRTEQNSLEN
jgi:hypothetical protein